MTQVIEECEAHETAPIGWQLLERRADRRMGLEDVQYPLGPQVLGGARSILRIEQACPGAPAT